MWAVPEFSQDLAEFLKFSSIKGLRVLQNPIVIGWQIDREIWLQNIAQRLIIRIFGSDELMIVKKSTL